MASSRSEPSLSRQRRWAECGCSGASTSDADPSSGNRTYGTVSVAQTSYPYPASASTTISLTQPTCNLTNPTNVTYGCTECVLGNVAGPSCPTFGDSGGPAFVNYTALGGSAVAGIPAGTSLVAGNLFYVGGGSPGSCGSAPDRYTGTWDTIYTQNGANVPGENGTWIRARVKDFDGDGVPNETDNCPVAVNPKQENCNLDAEIKWGFEKRGNACDPIPCGETEMHPPTVVVTQHAQNGVFESIPTVPTR